MKTETTITILLLFICVVWLYSERIKLKKELEFSKVEKDLIRKSWIWKSKRLKNYIQIVFITDSINESFEATKQAKRNNKQLKKLTEFIN